ncbi:helix-turn-helix domain-containing protein [Flavobacterium sp. FZUC8N2.13]|uniref:Helix-turn-helix domain-containing protein n=1 Tax=Flavobacterium zubiriense TaxID=3138075 RepID=A0ABV4TGP5_9FLAO
MENQNLAQGVKELRKRKALSQDELAKNAGLSLRTVQRVENGETIPTGETLKRIAAVLEVAPDELLGFTSEKETPKIVLKTKHEYVHFFNDKLVFSKTPEINLVDDYRKSVTYVFRTLMVFLIGIPLFTAIGIYFYSVGNIALAFFCGTFVFLYLVSAVNTMLFGSGSPVVNIDAIINIKIEKKLSYNIVNISILESGRIKQRGLVLEKEQMQTVIDTLLVEKLLDKKDIKINTKSERIKFALFFVYIMGTCLFLSYYPKLNYLTTYFQSGILFIVCLNVILKMLQNSVFLNSDIRSKGFLKNDKSGLNNQLVK